MMLGLHKSLNCVQLCFKSSKPLIYHLHMLKRMISHLIKLRNHLRYSFHECLSHHCISMSRFPRVRCTLFKLLIGGWILLGRVYLSFVFLIYLFSFFLFTSSSKDLQTFQAPTKKVLFDLL